MSPSDLFFVDHALSARLEAAEVAQVEAMARAVAERQPERGVALLSIAGGCASFVGPNISVSRAVGLGMSGPVTPADLDALENFYRSRNSEARLYVSPFARPSLFEGLGERGFRVRDLMTTLARPLSGAEPFAEPAGARSERGAGEMGSREAREAGERAVREAGEMKVRRAGLEEAATWADALLRGFSSADEPPHRDHVAVFEAAFHDPSALYFFATIGGAIAGTAGMRIHGGLAHFYGASTQPAARGRGVQAALIDHRLEIARARGCDFAFTVTEAGTTSQRNFERRGFRTVYSRARMTKRFG